MRRLKLLPCLAIAFLSGHALAQASTPDIDQLQQQRQKFVRDDKIDLLQLSHDIEDTAREANALDRAGRGSDAWTACWN
ncbi:MULTISPECIES: hypothetical protein [unclassified Burkholderia]|uniref:hypothetical protein n=1 Tax=unclassified Burkholderia TaxID=2613784 RepID=UPI0014216326|nr:MULTISPECIES: hypothetical protein [unclassified Burkholderia]